MHPTRSRVFIHNQRTHARIRYFLAQPHSLERCALHPCTYRAEYATLRMPPCDREPISHQKRAQAMTLHEYQSKQLFARYGIAVPTGIVAANAAEATEAARKIGGSKWVVKAQVHAGGRGKGGGVKLVDSPEAAGAAAAALIGKRLHTHQTGPEGLPIHQVFVEQGSKIERELYVSLVLNRDKG